MAEIEETPHAVLRNSVCFFNISAKAICVGLISLFGWGFILALMLLGVWSLSGIPWSGETLTVENLSKISTIQWYGFLGGILLAFCIAIIVPGYIASKYAAGFEYRNMVALGLVTVAVMELVSANADNTQESFLTRFIFAIWVIAMFLVGGWFRRKRNHWSKAGITKT